MRLIGRGGMGVVYEAVNPSINRRAAIKVLRPECAEREDLVRRFFNEARAVNTINHPGVVQVSEVGKAPDGGLYLVMDYLEGDTLSDRLTQRSGKLSEEEAVTISWQLAAVLTASHEKSIVHRDIKPGNVMLVPDVAGPNGERVKLLDFGIAKLGSQHVQGDEVRTRTGELIGTVSYMSPEQLHGKRQIDGQSDVYALGVLMYRLLAGRLPFISPSGDMAIAAMHIFKQPKPLRALAPTVAPWLHGLVDAMLAKEPTDRPTMQEVKARLTEYLPFRLGSSSELKPLSLSAVKESERPSFAPTVEVDESWAAGGIRWGSGPTVLGDSKPAPKPELEPKLEPSAASQSNAGSISRLTGQISGISGVIKRNTLLAISFSVLLVSGAGWFVLQSSTPGQMPADTTLRASMPAAATSQTPEKPPGKSVEKPGKSVEKPAAHGASETRQVSSATASPKLAKPAIAPRSNKSSRRVQKTNEKRDGKPRSSNGSQPIDIID